MALNNFDNKSVTLECAYFKCLPYIESVSAILPIWLALTV